MVSSGVLPNAGRTRAFRWMRTVLRPDRFHCGSQRRRQLSANPRNVGASISRWMPSQAPSRRGGRRQEVHQRCVRCVNDLPKGVAQPLLGHRSARSMKAVVICALGSNGARVAAPAAQRRRPFAHNLAAANHSKPDFAARIGMRNPHPRATVPRATAQQLAVRH